jgi:hypothetical protein
MLDMRALSCIAAAMATRSEDWSKARRKLGEERTGEGDAGIGVGLDCELDWVGAVYR